MIFFEKSGPGHESIVFKQGVVIFKLSMLVANFLILLIFVKLSLLKLLYLTQTYLKVLNCLYPQSYEVSIDFWQYQVEVKVS